LKAVPSTLWINREHPGAESEGLGSILAEDFQGREKAGKPHAMPCHHNLEEYLTAYLDGAGLRGGGHRLDP
jgi:hypothetical protein